MFMKIGKLRWLRVISLLVLMCFMMWIPVRADADTVGSGARIITPDDEGQARFHFGDTVGSDFYLTAEATGDNPISNISFESSNPSVCTVVYDEEERC